MPEEQKRLHGRNGAGPKSMFDISTRRHDDSRYRVRDDDDDDNDPE